MHDFSIAANPQATSPAMPSPAEIESAIVRGRTLLKQGDLDAAECAFWQVLAPDILHYHEHHLRNFLGEGGGIIDRVQELTANILLELGYLYEDKKEYTKAACCYKKLLEANKNDIYAWSCYDTMQDKHGAGYDERTWTALQEKAKVFKSQRVPETPERPAPATESVPAHIIEPLVYNAA